MTKRTRYFLAGSAMILLVGLGTGLVAYYNGGLPLFARHGSGPADLAFVPQDSAFVAYANVRQIMDSQFRQKLRQVLPAGTAVGKDELMAETGIDLEKDIDTVIAAMSFTSASTKSPIVLVRGRFKGDQIEALAKQHGGASSEYKGVHLVMAPDMSSHAAPADMHPADLVSDRLRNAAESGCIGFLEDGLIAIGEVTAVKHAIDVRESHEAVTANSELMKIITDIDGSSNAWVVGRLDAVKHIAGMDLPKEATDRLSLVQWFAVTTRISDGVSGSIRAEARDDKAAEDLREVVRGGLAAARLVGSGSGQDARVDAMLNSLQLGGSGKTVKVSFTVPANIIDMLSGGLNGLGGLMNGIGR